MSEADLLFPPKIDFSLPGRFFSELKMCQSFVSVSSLMCYEQQIAVNLF